MSASAYSKGHAHSWGPRGYCSGIGCEWRLLKSGIRARRILSKVLPCGCMCHIGTMAERPYARWRIEFAFRDSLGHPETGILQSTRALCAHCYRETRRGEGAVDFIRFVTGREREAPHEGQTTAKGD